MFSVTSMLFIFIGVAFILISIIQRWVLAGFYREMDEWSWFFWGSAVPYIENPDGRAEFAKTVSDVFLVEGGIHVGAGVILLPFPDFPLLLGAWAVLLIVITLAERGAFIDVAMELNRKYARLRKSPKKVCPKCGREMWLDFKLCPKCGELLLDRVYEV